MKLLILLLATSCHAGIASWYDAYGMTCASRTYTNGSVLKVTEIHNGSSVIVTVNDYGPAKWTGCEIDLSVDAFSRLDGLELGHADVKIERIYGNTTRH